MDFTKNPFAKLRIIVSDLAMKTWARKLGFWIFSAMLSAVNAMATTHFVGLNSTNATPPYTDWRTAATNIQDAIDVSSSGDQILVTNGIYQTGGRVVNGYALTNRVAVTKTIIVQSVNGPAVTIIQGYQMPGVTNGDGAVRCVYLTNGATLEGFTLTNGATRVMGDTSHECNGGGAWCESVSAVIFDCVLDDNAAYSAGGGICNGWVIDCTLDGNRAGSTGGGIYQGTLINCALNKNSANAGGGVEGANLYSCTLISNSASLYGGGSENSIQDNCTFTGNVGPFGGGAHGGTLNNCILEGNSAYFGGGADSSELNGCLLTNNSASQGGGAWYGTLNSCILLSNFALEYGGGAYVATLNNCTLNKNSASFGGGADSSTLNNCTVTGNFAANYDGDGAYPTTPRGGGAYSSTLNNCIVYFNTNPSLPVSPNHYFCTLNSCCTTTDAEGGGSAAVTNDPLFVNMTSGDFHLQSNSPCINSGNNGYVTTTNDLDGNPRIVGSTVDIGAYEYQTPSSIISYAWLQQYSLPTDGSADYVDTDGDGLNNWQEWIAGTDPTNPLSVLKMLAPASTDNPSGLVVSWQSVDTRTYYLQRSTNLISETAFSTIQSNIVGQADTTFYTDTTATNGGPFFYRVGVQ